MLPLAGRLMWRSLQVSRIGWGRWLMGGLSHRWCSSVWCSSNCQNCQNCLTETYFSKLTESNFFFKLSDWNIFFLKLSDWNIFWSTGPLHFQELGTLLNSLKEGVKTVTAITKYGMMKPMVLVMLVMMLLFIIGDNEGHVIGDTGFQVPCDSIIGAKWQWIYFCSRLSLQVSHFKMTRKVCKFYQFWEQSSETR